MTLGRDLNEEKLAAPKPGEVFQEEKAQGAEAPRGDEVSLPEITGRSWNFMNEAASGVGTNQRGGLASPHSDCLLLTAQEACTSPV